MAENGNEKFLCDIIICLIISSNHLSQKEKYLLFPRKKKIILKKHAIKNFSLKGTRIYLACTHAHTFSHFPYYPCLACPYQGISSVACYFNFSTASLFLNISLSLISLYLCVRSFDKTRQTLDDRRQDIDIGQFAFGLGDI